MSYGMNGWNKDADGDLISREAAVDAVAFGITYAKVIDKDTGEITELFKQSNDELQKAIERIERLPSAQPERMRGRWIPLWRLDVLDGYRCSACEAWSRFKFNFCRNCGADMREGGQK